MAFYPIVLLRNRNLLSNQTLVRHEQIHLKQQLELLILPFYLIYLVEFGVGFAKHRNWQKAYRSISFEKEAFANEADNNYLKDRGFYAMWQSKKRNRNLPKI